MVWVGKRKGVMIFSENWHSTRARQLAGQRREGFLMTNPHSGRFVSRLTRETLALVLAGGRGSRLKQLTDWRAKPAVPFGGKFRIIDFPLSNCVNSGIRRVAVLTQYKSHSLLRHIQHGWSFLRAELGEFVELLPIIRIDITTERPNIRISEYFG
jgi:hypothetical protein